MVVIISALSTVLYIAQQPNYDLKYRYIKMKGEATPKQIAELETIFESNRDNTKIKQMHKDVEQYEEIVRKRAIAIEQARLKQLEANQLSEKVEKMNKK